MHQSVVTAVTLTEMHKIQVQDFIATLFHHHRVFLHDPAFSHRGDAALVECLKNTGLHDTDRRY